MIPQVKPVVSLAWIPYRVGHCSRGECSGCTNKHEPGTLFKRVVLQVERIEFIVLPPDPKAETPALVVYSRPYGYHPNHLSATMSF